jgi:hypothetical protein
MLSIPIELLLLKSWNNMIPNNKKMGKFGMSVFKMLENTTNKMANIKSGSIKDHAIPKTDDL